MKKKTTTMLMTLGLLATTMAMGSHQKVANAEGELAIFENGTFTKEVDSFGANGAITDNVFHNDASGNASRVLLKEAFDLSTYANLTITYSVSETTSDGKDPWAQFGIANVKLYGEFDYVTKDLSSTNTETTISIDDYASETTTSCTWGGTHSASLDMTDIKGFCIKSNATVSISKIIAVQSAPVLQDENIFKDGTWSDSSAYADPKVAANSILEDNMWKIRGEGTKMCRVLFNNALNIKGYKRLIISYKNASIESMQFGVGTIESYVYTSVHKSVTLIKDSADIKTFEVNLIDYDGVAFDQHQWATPTGNLNLANVMGFDFVSDGGNIDVVSIVATATEATIPFDPTAVDKSLFDNTSVAENAADFGNAAAYRIEYGSKNYAYVGTADTANNLNTGIATRVADGDNYAIQYNKANLIRYDNAAASDLTSAMLNDGWLEFDLNFVTAPASNKFSFRLYDEALYGERYFVNKEMSVEGAVGSYHSYRIALKDLSKYCLGSSWTPTFEDSSKIRLINMSAIKGMGFAFDQDVTVQIRNLHYGYTPVDHTITGIEATTTKPNYNSGEKVDVNTFKVNVLFDDNTKAENISNFTVKDIGKVTADNKKVEVSFKHGSEKYTTDVELSINTARSLVIKTMPEKLIYNVGDKLDLKGIVVEAIMSDESTKNVDISELQVSVDIVSQGDEEIIISYAGASTTFTITVNSNGKSYAAFNDSYLTYDEATKTANPKQGYFVGGNDNNSETPTAYVDKVDGKSVFVTNQTVDWRISRFLSSDGVLDLQAISVDYEISVLITYRTSNVASGKFYLFNPVETSTWDQVYSNANVSFNNDGAWHKAKVSFDDLIVNTVGHLDSGDIPTGYSMISPKKISGWGLTAVGKVEVAEISYIWESNLDAKWNDTKAPEITYEGETTFNQVEGEKPHEVKATAYDSYDGEITPKYTWSEGALDANGNLKAGTHTLTISAVDKAGNEAAIRTITYVVTASGNPDPTPTPDPEVKKGLPTGAIVGIVAGSVVVIGGVVGAYFFFKNKKANAINEENATTEDKKE